MIQSLEEANQELKRVDHLVYVSLKYTRTVDVLMNTIKRMVEAYDFMFETLLKKAIEEKILDEMPKTPIEKGNKLKEIYLDDEEVAQNVGLYFLLRKLSRAQNLGKEQEYRRHVTMTTIVDGREEMINIDIVTSYYHSMREFFTRVEKIILGERE